MKRNNEYEQGAGSSVQSTSLLDLLSQEIDGFLGRAQDPGSNDFRPDSAHNRAVLAAVSVVADCIAIARHKYNVKHEGRVPQGGNHD